VPTEGAVGMRLREACAKRRNGVVEVGVAGDSGHGFVKPALPGGKPVQDLPVLAAARLRQTQGAAQRDGVGEVVLPRRVEAGVVVEKVSEASVGDAPDGPFPPGAPRRRPAPSALPPASAPFYGRRP
jgi:hypothetical protein